MWGEGDLELGKDTVPQMTVINCLRRIGNKPITYDNSFPPKNQIFLSEMQVKYIKDIFVARGTSNLGMSGKEMVQVIMDIGQADYCA